MKKEGFTTMNRTQLIAEVAKDANVTKKNAEEVIVSFLAQVEKALKKGDRVQLVGFGTFEVKTRAAHNGRNPATGATIKVAASRYPTFSAGKSLKEAVKNKKKK